MAFQFELVSPERLMYSGEAISVIVPGAEGEFTVLEDHAPLMSTLKPGIVTVEAPDAILRLLVWGGFADVEPTGLTILADRAVLIEEIDAATIDADIKAAQDDLANASSDDEKDAAGVRLEQFLDLRAALGL